MLNRLSSFSGPLSPFSNNVSFNLKLYLDSLNYDFYGKLFTFDSANSSGVTFSSNSVTSNGGGGWETYTRSVESYNGPIKLNFQKGVVGGALMCGLSDLSVGGSYTNINFGFYLQNDNLVTIVENQSSLSNVVPFYQIYEIPGTYTTSTIYSIVFDGIRVRYYIDDVLVYTSYSSPMVTPLYLFITFLNNAGISVENIEFGSLSPIWNDISGNANDFNLINSPNYSNGSLNFNSNLEQYATGSNLGTLKQFTVDTWFKLNSLPATEFNLPQIVTDIYSADNNNNLNFSLGFQTGFKIYGGFFIYPTWYYTDDGFTPEIDTWYNVTLTYDEEYLNLYLDGVLYSSTSYGVQVSSGGLGINIGKRWDLSEFIDGEIDVVRILNGAVSSAQILNNYNSIKPRYIFDTASIVLDGSSSIEVPRGTDFALGTTYTIEFWSKAATNSAGQIFTVMSQRDTSEGIDIFYQGDKLVIRNGVNVTGEPTPGVWTHVAIVSDNNNLSVYYNGLSQSVNPVEAGNLQDDKYPLAIGCRGPYNNFQYFNGSLWGIRINNGVVYSTDFNPYEVALPPTNIPGTVLLVNEYSASTGNFIDSSYNKTLVNKGATHSTDVPTNYRYLRWVMTQTKGADNFAAIQASDLVLLYNGATVIWGPSASATNPDGGSTPNELAPKLLDYDINTKWCDLSFGTTSFGTSSIYIDNVTPIFFNSYYYVTGNDSPDRDPVSWTLAVSNDNSTWTVLSTQSNVVVTDDRYAITQTFSI